MIAAEWLTQDYIGNFFLRYLHTLVGITWIGLLYYFNFVQVPGLAAYGDEGRARNITVTQIATRALWWFRWASVATLATGLLITIVIPKYFQNQSNSQSAVISVGMLIAILMAANVWMIIWKNQRVVIANATNVLAGGEPDPGAAIAGRKALLASRQNMVFSVSMLFYMVGTSHFYTVFSDATQSNANIFLLISLVVIAVLECNAVGLLGGIKAGNKMLWPYESHRNAIISSFVLLAAFFTLSVVLFS